MELLERKPLPELPFHLAGLVAPERQSHLFPSDRLVTLQLGQELRIAELIIAWLSPYHFLMKVPELRYLRFVTRQLSIWLSRHLPQTLLLAALVSSAQAISPFQQSMLICQLPYV